MLGPCQLELHQVTLVADVHACAVSLVPESAYLNQISADNRVSTNVLSYGNGTVYRNSSCSGSSCNAAKGSWLTVNNLYLTETYLLVAGSRFMSSANNGIWVLG